MHVCASLLLVASLTVIAPTAAGAQDVRECSGSVATIVGTPGNDYLVGTDGPDVIAGLQGNDTIFGLAGDDIICGGFGADIIIGGDGFDILFGAQGRDFLISANGTGQHLVEDVRGARMFGGQGDDLIWGSDRWDRIQGGPGDDTIIGLAGRDWIRAGAGADRIDGGAGIDDIRGAAGNDHIDVTINDLIRAGVGTDTCNIQGRATQLWSCENERPSVEFSNSDVQADRNLRVGPPEQDQVFVELPFKEFTINEASVTVPVVANVLPRQASVVEFSGTFIDNGRGAAEACTGGTFDSDPIQCGGTVIDGLGFSPLWASNFGFTRNGQHTARYSWPPVDGRSMLIEERFNEVHVRTDIEPGPLFPLPAECEDIEQLVGPNVLAAWGRANPDRFGGIIAGDTPRIFVLGDLEAVRNELRTADAQACVLPAELTADELAQAQEDITTALSASDIKWIGVGRGANRISVEVDVADLDTIEFITSIIDTPSVLEISGRLTIIE